MPFTMHTVDEHEYLRTLNFFFYFLIFYQSFLEKMNPRL